jgi:hypothetical protein
VGRLADLGAALAPLTGRPAAGLQATPR